MCRFRPLALAGAIAIALAVPGCGTLGRAELARGVASLGSMTAEARLLATAAAQDRTKATFTRVRASELAQDAQHEAEKLADATPQRGYERRRDAAVAIAEALGGPLGALQTAPGDEARAARVERALRRLAIRIDDLRGELGA